MYQPGGSFHLDKADRVVPGLTRDPGSGSVITDVVVEGVAEPGALHPVRLTLVASPRVLRRVAQELLDAADAACRREDAMTDPALPFVAVTE